MVTDTVANYDFVVGALEGQQIRVIHDEGLFNESEGDALKSDAEFAITNVSAVDGKIGVFCGEPDVGYYYRYGRKGTQTRAHEGHLLRTYLRRAVCNTFS
jgi:hypothetical protein